MFATILSGVGSFVGQFNFDAGAVIGVIALCFDMGLYLNDIVTSGFDEAVIEEAAQSIIQNAGFFVLGATALEIKGATILVKNIYSAILNGTCVGMAMMSSACQLTDYVLRILNDHETMELVDYFYM